MASTSSALVTSITPMRLTSLDQFRGYTVVGMILVNYVGGFSGVPEVLKHHNDYCSYADTIMPQFLFAVGFAFRLTFERRVLTEGLAAAYRRVVSRLFGLALVAIVVYGTTAPADTWEELMELGPAALTASLKRNWFQTLMHIAATSFWLLPVIRSSIRVRLMFASISAVLHVILSWQFNFLWCNSPPNAIDGGPLGFLTWIIPAIAGTIACDCVASTETRTPLRQLAIGAVVLMVAGWGMSCGTRFYDVPLDSVEDLREQRLAEHPVIPTGDQLRLPGFAEAPFFQPPPIAERKWNYWMMSQRSGTLSYLTFCTGFSLLVYLLFYYTCDRLHWESPLLRVFGSNGLICYILHSIVMDAVKPFVPKDSPLWYVASSWIVVMAILWTFVRHLERNRVFLRL